MSFLRHFVIRMHLYGQILTRINELDKQGELIAELLIDAFAYKKSFVFVNQLGEVETEIHITDDAAFNCYGLMSGYGTDFPRLADIRLRGIYALEGRNLIATPDGGL